MNPLMSMPMGFHRALVTVRTTMSAFIQMRLIVQWVHDNCDGNTDDASALNTGVLFGSDGDGYGHPNSTTYACNVPWGIH